MSITKDQILEAVAAMSVMDVVELVSAMEEKFGVSAAAAVAVAAAGPSSESGGWELSALALLSTAMSSSTCHAAEQALAQISTSTQPAMAYEDVSVLVSRPLYRWLI